MGRYVDVLEGLFAIRRLPPYFANVGKRLTKAPGVYLRDSGLLHALLGIRGLEGLRARLRGPGATAILVQCSRPGPKP